MKKGFTAVKLNATATTRAAAWLTAIPPVHRNIERNTALSITAVDVDVSAKPPDYLHQHARVLDAFVPTSLPRGTTITMHGKVRRTGRRGVTGHTASWKKAIVTLAPGQKLEGLFGSL